MESLSRSKNFANKPDEQLEQDKSGFEDSLKGLDDPDILDCFFESPHKTWAELFKKLGLLDICLGSLANILEAAVFKKFSARVDQKMYFLQAMVGLLRKIFPLPDDHYVTNLEPVQACVQCVSVKASKRLNICLLKVLLDNAWPEATD